MLFLLVPGTRIELVQSQGSRDFKSLASTCSATQAIKTFCWFDWIFSEKSELIVVKQGDNVVSSIPLSSGRAIVVYEQKIVSSSPVWVYSPEGKETVKTDISYEDCFQKWQSLDGGSASNYHEYLVK